MLELDDCHGEEFTRWIKVQAFFYARVQVNTSVFSYKLG
jgi:hypothetical protein